MSRLKRWVAALAAAMTVLGFAASARADEVADACLDYISSSAMLKQAPAEAKSKYCGCMAGKFAPADRVAGAAVIKAQKEAEAKGGALNIETLPPGQKKAGGQYFDAAGACLPILMGGAAGGPPAGAKPPSPKPEMKVLAKASGWEAFGGTTSEGTPLCGLSIERKKSWFSLKYFKGDGHLTGQIGNSEWTGKAGEKVALRLKFDDGKPWRADATTFKIDKETALEFKIDADQIEDWMADFKDGDTLRIAFVDSDVPAWTADLKGTEVVSEAMVDCMEKMLSRKRRR